MTQHICKLTKTLVKTVLSIWQKFENIDSITVCVVQEALLYVFQAIFVEVLGLYTMMQNLYLLDIFVNIDTNEVAPYICNYDDGKQICHTFLDSDVRVFDVEAVLFRPLNIVSICHRCLYISSASSALQYETRN